MNIIREIQPRIKRGRAGLNVKQIYEEDSEAPVELIFVFPSDLNEMNRKGIANIAVHKYGASYYQNQGPSNNFCPRSYAIPVTDDGKPLTSYNFASQVRTFAEYSQKMFINQGYQFFINDFTKYVSEESIQAAAKHFRNSYGCFFPQTFTDYLLQVDIGEVNLCQQSNESLTTNN